MEKRFLSEKIENFYLGMLRWLILLSATISIVAAILIGLLNLPGYLSKEKNVDKTQIIPDKITLETYFKNKSEESSVSKKSGQDMDSEDLDTPKTDDKQKAKYETIAANLDKYGTSTFGDKFNKKVPESIVKIVKLNFELLELEEYPANEYLDQAVELSSQILSAVDSQKKIFNEDKDPENNPKYTRQAMCFPGILINLNLKLPRKKTNLKKRLSRRH